MGKLPLGPSKLSKILAHLNAEPKLSMTGVSKLKYTLPVEGDHRGAREFLKDQLPRIQYANPDLNIQVDKVKSKPGEKWKPELELTFANGQEKKISMLGKWCPSIVKELMDEAGGNTWKLYKSEARAAGKPIIPGEEKEKLFRKRVVSTLGKLPTRPAPSTPSSNLFNAGRDQSASQTSSPQPTVPGAAPVPPPPKKTGAAAVLP